MSKPDITTPRAYKKKNHQWKNEYLRILLNGPASPDDYPLAAELLDEQMARGSYLPNYRSPLEINNLRWQGITTKGRLFADELQDKIRRSTWWYRALLALGSFGWWLAGYFTEAALDRLFG
ncbi:hypothetical protein [Pseudomonas sp. MYb185]|uniref:hypothetical protein n=1 Tax=Pseudomonas sp. MYb185 TaxID=1848729 RepID=UPI0011AFFCA0|nr:hypothetical protein [Pseudomonas sp. MYb185]